MIREEVKNNANLIWRLILENREIAVLDIAKMIHCDQALTMMALGWLAQEKPISFVNVNGVLNVHIDKLFSELYY